MNIHNQFNINYFIVFIVILLAVNLLIFKFQKRDWRELFNWKLILLALVFTFLGLFYSEISSSGDWNEKILVFLEVFILKKYLKILLHL
jgi:biotin transporter BioY